MKVDRRSFLITGLGAAGSAVLTAGRCQAAGVGASTRPLRRLALTAEPAVLDLGAGVTVETWAYADRTPEREVRITAGDTLAADLVNRLPDGVTTSVHWHGVATPNAADGAPPITQPMLDPGESFAYRFLAAQPGTYFLHSHVGVQQDRGLYAPLIVEDPREPLSYDEEWVIVLDDWLDGVTGTPDDVLAELCDGMSGSGSDTMSRGTRGRRAATGGDSGTGGHLLQNARSPLLGGHAGDVRYPYHLVNGRVPDDPEVRTASPGCRIRLRIINAGADTAYRVALGGHQLTVTHADGFPVEHHTGDAVLVGMGERYDALVTLDDGVFPLVALAEGKGAAGLAVVRTGSGDLPDASVRPSELDGSVIMAWALRAAEEARLPDRTPDRSHHFRLTGGMRRYDWAINGRRFDMDHWDEHLYLVHGGERVRLEFMNATGMWHPIHLHGHTCQLGAEGPRKDTAILLPGQRLSLDFDADNPGNWLFHCHNLYHGEAGMMAVLAYRD